ncbi:MAG TPA: glycosyltransferase family 87 protein, partial [Candidatus Eisenbacteria bacterium]|nr:glycosyltransferase family 87 protein [Candidatus Eisenbacteria bacterium]
GVRRGDSRGELLAGVAIGVATVVKVFPGALLVWFVLTRRWRAAAGVVAGAVAFVLVTMPFTGIEPWREFPAVLANLSAPSDTTDTLAPTVWLARYLGFSAARILVSVAGLLIVASAALQAGRIEPARAFAIAMTASVLIAPALYHHYLALLVLPFVLALGAGVQLRWLALAYFLMWGGHQNAIGDAAWIVNRALPTAGAFTLLLGLLVGSRGRGPQP